MIIYLVLIFISFEVMLYKKVEKYFFIPALVLFASYVVSHFVPSLDLVGLTKVTTSLLPISIVFAACSLYLGVLLFLQQKVKLSHLRMFLIALNCFVYENLLLFTCFSFLFVFYEIFLRSKRANYVVKTQLSTLFLFLPLFIFISGNETLALYLDSFFLLIILSLVVIEPSRLTLARCIAIIGLAANITLVNQSYFVMTVSLVVMLALFFLQEIAAQGLVDKKKLKVKFLGHVVSYLILKSQKRERRLAFDVEKVSRVKSETLSTHRQITKTAFVNDARANVMFLIFVFAMIILFFILKDF